MHEENREAYGMYWQLPMHGIQGFYAIIAGASDVNKLDSAIITY